ncbi:MAG TPA: metalloregulator ArsR/SmtB family transcription factor [Ktedonobacterales bacterium]|nr:metalloregulator ArsR/SmtB family transcription factor [Ktedonobacterales bacterium]
MAPEGATTMDAATCCEPQALTPARLAPAHVAPLAERLKALADPTRLGLLDLLARQGAPVCVCDLTPHFAQRQPTISHHLRLLREAGLIRLEKRGTWSYYAATPAGTRALALVEALDRPD